MELDEIWQTGRRANSGWHLGAVKIEAQADAVFADVCEHMCNVIQDQINRRVGIPRIKAGAIEIDRERAAE